MKNKVWLVCVIILIVVAISLILFFLNHHSGNIDKFKAEMEKSNYIVKEVTSSDSNITKAINSMKKDYSYQISFYEYNNEENAKAGYSHNLENLKTYKTTEIATDKSSSSSHHEKYELTIGDKYRVLYRSKNNLVYVDASISSKDEINSALSKYGI